MDLGETARRTAARLSAPVEITGKKPSEYSKKPIEMTGEMEDLVPT